ncbi:aminoglycoside phosphotransferase family protein [Actinomycetes bacterium KLBMP 9759]
MPVRTVDLIRIGTNAVFRINGDTIARVAPRLDLLTNAQLQIDVAGWLENVGFPAVRAVHVDQPIIAGAHVVTLWRSACEGEVYAPIADVARIIRDLHKLPAPVGIDLPDLVPFGPPDAELPTFEGLAPADAEFLRERLDWARRTFADLPFALEPGVIHGDANVGNVLLDDAGEAVLIDLDSFSRGPREWDLIQTAIFADRFGWHTAEEYRTFVEVYGYDITTWAGYEDLALMREVSMTRWISKKARTSDAARKEATKRIVAIRSGVSRRDWGAY